MSRGSLGFGLANYKWTEDERETQRGLEILCGGHEIHTFRFLWGPWNPRLFEWIYLCLITMNSIFEANRNPFFSVCIELEWVAIWLLCFKVISCLLSHQRTLKWFMCRAAFDLLSRPMSSYHPDRICLCQNKRSSVTITGNAWLGENLCFQLVQQFSVSLISNGLGYERAFQRLLTQPVGRTHWKCSICESRRYSVIADLDRFAHSCKRRLFCMWATSHASCIQMHEYCVSLKLAPFWDDILV